MLTASCCRSWKLQVPSQGLTCLSWERRVSLLGLAMSWAQVRASIQTATTGEGVGGLGWGNLRAPLSTPIYIPPQGATPLYIMRLASDFPSHW